MAVVYLGARDGLIDGAPLQHLRRRKFRAVVKGDAFEDCPEPSGTAFPLQRIQRRRGGQIALQVGGGVQLLNTDDILYLETRDRLLHYHTAADTWSVRGSLQKAEKELAPYHFARCNQCYLVNLRHVTGVQNDFVQIGQEQLEISRRQRVAFLAAVAAYVGGAL